MTGTGETQHDDVAPLFQVVRGNPDDADIAALAAVLAALPAGDPEASTAEASTSPRAVLRNQAWKRRHLAGQPGPWRSGRG